MKTIESKIKITEDYFNYDKSETREDLIEMRKDYSERIYTLTQKINERPSSLISRKRRKTVKSFETVVEVIDYKISELNKEIKSLGADIIDNKYSVFTYNEYVSNDNGENITLQKAISDENKMIELGYSGALIGHPYDHSDINTIYFEI